MHACMHACMNAGHVWKSLSIGTGLSRTRMVEHAARMTVHWQPEHPENSTALEKVLPGVCVCVYVCVCVCVCVCVRVCVLISSSNSRLILRRANPIAASNPRAFQRFLVFRNLNYTGETAKRRHAATRTQQQRLVGGRYRLVRMPTLLFHHFSNSQIMIIIGTATTSMPSQPI